MLLRVAPEVFGKPPKGVSGAVPEIPFGGHAFRCVFRCKFGWGNQRMKTAMRGSTLTNDAERHIPGVKDAPPPWPGDMVADLRSLAARIEEAEGLCDE